MSEEKPKEFSVRGLLKKIVGYETHHNSTTGPSGHPVCQTTIITQLELLTDGGKTLPINFQSYVGCELLDKRVTYTADTEVTNGETKSLVTDEFNRQVIRHARQDVTRQKLIPDDQRLPKYLAVNCTYVG